MICNGKGNISLRDIWQTPKDLFDILDKQYLFTLDCCADGKNSKCNRYSDDFLGIFLKKENNEMCWMNPPFSNAYIMFNHFFKVVFGGVAIYRCDNMETKLWQDIILKNADWIFIPNKRIAYEGMIGNGSRFPSALIGVGVKPPKELNGVVLKIQND